MQKVKYTKCPLCGKKYDWRFPAVSRYDDKTHVCPMCGTVEAFNPLLVRIAKAMRNGKGVSFAQFTQKGCANTATRMRL